MTHSNAINVAQAIEGTIERRTPVTRADLATAVAELRAEIAKIKTDLLIVYFSSQVALSGIVVLLIVKLLGH